jgi:hypothetical protein
MARARQQQTVSIDRGLFLIRYAAAEDTAHPPTVRVYAERTPNKEIGFLLHPDHRAAELWQPDSCLVARAMVPGKLTVEVTASCDGGSSAATVRIEPINQGTPIESEPAAPPVSAQAATGPAPSHSNGSGLRLLGHLPGIGDHGVNASEWLAGPAAPSRIEGITIDWPDKPDDLDIRYAIKTATAEPISGRLTDLGSFAGTRGKAMPIVALMLEMSGGAATNLQFVVQAAFLGAPVSRFVGKRIVATGPTGREALVGLQLSVENTTAGEQPNAASLPPPQAGRVRVFRSQPKSDAQSAPADQPKPDGVAAESIRVVENLQKPKARNGARAEAPAKPKSRNDVATKQANPAASPAAKRVRVVENLQKSKAHNDAAAADLAKSKKRNGVAVQRPQLTASLNRPAEPARPLHERPKSQGRNGFPAGKRKTASPPNARSVRGLRSRMKSKQHLTAN